MLVAVAQALMELERGNQELSNKTKNYQNRTIIKEVTSKNVILHDQFAHSSLHIARTNWYVQTGMCKLVCANWYVQTGMCKLLCANCYVQTAMCKLLCANCYVQTGMCKLLCTNCYVQTGCANWYVQNDIFASNFLNNGPIFDNFFFV